jgi:hypothetical protein
MEETIAPVAAPSNECQHAYMLSTIVLIWNMLISRSGMSSSSRPAQSFQHIRHKSSQRFLCLNSNCHNSRCSEYAPGGRNSVMVLIQDLATYICWVTVAIAVDLTAV